jgi:acyl dehydratase
VTNPTFSHDGFTSASARYGPLTRSDFVRYAGAGGDFNPIHHDETFAVGAGYRSVFGHGLLTAGLLSSFLVEWLGQSTLRSFEVRYADQVWPDDVLVMKGALVSAHEGPEGTELAVNLEVLAESHGETSRVVLRGRASSLQEPDALVPDGARGRA